jgi:hypothetical protein
MRLLRGKPNRDRQGAGPPGSFREHPWPFVLLLALSLASPALRGGPAEIGSAALLAQTIREAGLDAEECYRVRDLSYYKEDIKLYFHDGYLIFSRPVNGERLSAVFSSEVEGGDGEIILFPPHKGERQSMARFTQSPNLDEHFSAALLVFSDDTAHALYDRISQEGAGKKAPEMGPLLRDQWDSVVKNVTENFDLRLVIDLLHPDRDSPAERNREGLLFAAVAGKKLGNFDVVDDPRQDQQMLAGQMNTHDDRNPRYDVWTHFTARSIRNGTAKPLDEEFKVRRYQIDASILGMSGDTSGVQGLTLRAVTKATVRVGKHSLQVFPFELSRAIQVKSVQVDGKPAELLSRQTVRGRALRADQNESFVVVAPQPLAAESEHVVEFAHEGSVISFAGKGVYFVEARSNWYPQNGYSFSEYDLNFRYPKTLTLVAPGELKEESIDGDSKLSRYVTPVPIRVAGFNLGEYEKVSSTGSGVRLDVYGNRHLEYALAPKLREAVLIPAPPITGRGIRATPAMTGALTQTPSTPDPLGRLRVVADDVSACLQYFTSLFGPPAINSLTVAPVPGSFGQGFPGLVYLSTIAYIDATDRPAFARSLPNQTFFSDLIQAHEVAHQWWGNVVVPATNQDEWILEGLANYSAMMWLEKKKGPKVFEQLLQQYRDDLVTKDDKGKTIESAGPITWGYRIEASVSPAAWKVITYEKGSWIFHMIRKRLGDERFLKLLTELRRRYEFKAVGTEDLHALVKEFLPPKVSKSSVDLFFDNWVYSTGVPSLKLAYAVKGAAPQWKLSGSVEQSGVDNDFTAEVPVEIQFAKSPSQIVWAETSDEPATFSATLKEMPVKVTVGAGTTVLATKR